MSSYVRRVRQELSELTTIVGFAMRVGRLGSFVGRTVSQLVLGPIRFIPGVAQQEALFAKRFQALLDHPATCEAQELFQKHLLNPHGLVPALHWLALSLFKHAVGLLCLPLGLVLLARPHLFSRAFRCRFACHASPLEGFSIFLLPHIPPTIRTPRPILLKPPLNPIRFQKEALHRLQIRPSLKSSDFRSLFLNQEHFEWVSHCISDSAPHKDLPSVWYKRWYYWNRLRLLLVQVAQAFPSMRYKDQLRIQIVIKNGLNTPSPRGWINVLTELVRTLPVKTQNSPDAFIARRVGEISRTLLDAQFQSDEARLNAIELSRLYVPVAGAEGPSLPLPAFYPVAEWEEAPTALAQSLTLETLVLDLQETLSENQRPLYEFCRNTLPATYHPEAHDRVFRYLREVATEEHPLTAERQARLEPLIKRLLLIEFTRRNGFPKGVDPLEYAQHKLQIPSTFEPTSPHRLSLYLEQKQGVLPGTPIRAHIENARLLPKPKLRMPRRAIVLDMLRHYGWITG